MGNILTTPQGNIKPNINNTSFYKNINDTLLELDLYSLPKSGDPRSVTLADGNSIKPGEVDFTKAGLEARPKNKDGEYIDINGIPYIVNKDENYNDNNNTSYYNLNTDNTDPNYYKYTSKNYNFKRGFCNAQQKVPVDIIGVVFPTNSETIDSCLKYGTTKGPISAESDTNSTISIPDINKNDILNSKNTGLTSQNVYGKTLSDECKKILTNSLTNSYVNADINEYSKLRNILDPSTGGELNISSHILVEDVNNKIKIAAAVAKTAGNNNPTPIITNRDSFIPKNTYNTVGSVDTSALGIEVQTNNSNTSESCTNFYDINSSTSTSSKIGASYCDYYYQYDFIDGINQNNEYVKNKDDPTYLDKINPNITYLSRHIPDCVCLNSIPYRAGAVSKGPDGTGGLPAIEFYWIASKCGLKSDDRTFGSGSGNTLLYKKSNGTINTKGYGAQFDPNVSSSTNNKFIDKSFTYARAARAHPITVNSFTCNIDQSITTGDVGNNVDINGVNASCNFGGESNEPLSNTGMHTFSIAYNGDSLTNNTEPVDPFIKLEVTLAFPKGSTIPSNFFSETSSKSYIPNYGFGFIPSNASTSIQSNFIMGKFICEIGSGPDTPLPKQCSISKTGPISATLITPFLYGSTTNEYGLDYLIYFKPEKDIYSLISPPPPIPILLKQFGMQITNVIPGKISASKFYLQFNIKFNCSITFFLDYAIVLTPQDTTKPTLTYSGTDFFEDVKGNSTKGLISAESGNSGLDDNADGSLTIGNDSDTIILATTQYTYNIILNPTVTSPSDGISVYKPGYIMYYSSDVPLSISESGSLMDFSKLISKFVSVAVGYLDSKNYNQFTLFPSETSTYEFGNVIVINWQFLNLDKYTGIDFYYTYDGLTNPIKINSTELSINKNTYSFPGPQFANATTINVYAQTIGGSEKALKSSINFPISLTSQVAPDSYKTMSVLPNVKITTPKVVDATGIPSAVTLQGVDIITGNLNYTTDLATTANVTTSATNYIVMRINDSKNKVLKVSLTDSTDKPIAANATIKIGTEINLNWSLSPSYSVPVQVQVILFGIVYSVITIDSAIGTYKLPIYDINGSKANQSTTLSLSVFGSNVPVVSAPINLTVTNPLLTYTKLPDNNIITIAPLTPYICVSNNTTGLGTIKNLTIDSSILNNTYFNVFKGFNSSLEIQTNIISLKSIDYTKPLVINYTASTEVSFTNVYDNIRKKTKNIEKLENVKNVVYIDVLRLDLSQAPGFNSNLIINYIFNNYDEVYIQNLELFFGTTKIDDSVFNISLLGTPKMSNGNLNNSGSPIYIDVSTVRFIGIMTSKVFVPVPIPYATTFLYSPNKKKSDGTWANEYRLNSNNGYYSINTTDLDKIQKANELAINKPSGLNWILISIIIFVILVLLCVGAYFIFFRKSAIAQKT
jgi:hypothetical protein